MGKTSLDELDWFAISLMPEAERIIRVRRKGEEVLGCHCYLIWDNRRAAFLELDMAGRVKLVDVTEELLCNAPQYFCLGDTFIYYKMVCRSLN